MDQKGSNLATGSGVESYIASFLSANNVSESFGSFRIPKSFVAEFGKNLPSRVRIKCKMFEWKAKYDKDLKLLHGMRRFMKYYEIKIYGVVQFDYYGNDQFGVRVFKNSAIESNYRNMTPSKFLSSKKCRKWRKDEYILDGLSLHYQMSVALWSFNAFMNYVDYCEIRVNNVHIDGRYPFLILSKEFENLYKEWENSAELYLRFTEDTWKIDVKRMDNSWVLGNQWYGFAEEVGLEVGDTLVFYKIPYSEPYTVNVCLFKGKEQRIDDSRGKNGALERSFLKIVTQHCLDEGIMFVPKRIKEKYGEKLGNITEVEVFGNRCPFSYNSTGGYLSNVGPMIERFNLRKKETVVFTMNHGNLLCARIYQMDGKEIDYENRSISTSDNGQTNWFWDIHWNSEADVNLVDNVGEEYVQTLTVSNPANMANIFNGMNPLFVVAMDCETMRSDELKLPERFLVECSQQIPQNVRLCLPNGREIHAHFTKRDKCLWPMSEFFKECRILFGSIGIYSYEGNGIFQVFVLKEDFCEVDYFQSRLIPRAKVFDQDSINGVGWKFTTIANEHSIESGEIDLPRRFCRMFGRNIPEAVSFSLANDRLISGHYLHEERKMTGMLELVGLNFLQENDLLLLTYCGAGKFNMVIFDSARVEKKMNGLENDTESAYNDINDEAEMEDENAEHISDTEMNEVDLENNNGAEINDIVMNDPIIGFSAIMTKCNVNNTSHGAYIPDYVRPTDRRWISGEHVTFRREDRAWDIGIVYSNGLARFSAGWNRFARDNHVKLNETLVFNLLEAEGGAVFNINIPGRS